MQNSMIVFTFSVFGLQVLSKKYIWHFNVIYLISQQFTHKDLEPVAFLVEYWPTLIHFLIAIYIFIWHCRGVARVQNLGNGGGKCLSFYKAGTKIQKKILGGGYNSTYFFEKLDCPQFVWVLRLCLDVIVKH